jgi:membrane protein insertase Oxa1/YidC/SpoIIIJ
MKVASRSLSNNVGWSGRIRQLLILILTILIGLMIASVAEAQDFHKAKKRHFKAKYKTQLNMADQECAILNKKRNARPASGLFATRPKYKPQAEIDPPRYAVVR